MDKNKQKEQFNIAYVCALAAHAGLNFTPPVVDDDSVDVMLMGKGYSGKIRNPQIHLQLKCTGASSGVENEDNLKYRLKRKNYDDLRGDNVICPRFLVVLIVPDDQGDWIEHQDEGMVLRHLCYWKSIRSYPETDKESVTVSIPIIQRLTAESLLQLMNNASNEIHQ